MKLSWKEDKYGIIGMICFTVIMLALALLTDGTGDEGDSINHYLGARYAMKYPEHFFNHWSKPVYVLFAFPFSQFGFIGVKLMNAALSCIAMWFTYLTARHLKYKWASAVFIIALFFKVFMIVSLSGLTEPLHNAALSIAIYLAFTRRLAWAVVIASFLPFIRSEGLCVCGVFALYLLIIKQWRLIPLLIVGHLVYAIAGYPIHKDLMWVISKIPYSIGDQHYGHGTWLSFVKAMPYITSPVACGLLVIGLCAILGKTIYFLSKKRVECIRIEPLFLAAIFFAFFMMHTTFWALGTFGSFGLTRVFVAIAGIMMLIMVSALDLIDESISSLHSRHSHILGFTVVSAFLFFAVGRTPFGYFADRDFGLHSDQLCDKDLAAYVKQNIPGYQDYYYYFDAYYFALLFDIDIYDHQKFRNDQHGIGQFPMKSIVIWDDWYSKFEHNTSLEMLRNSKSLREVKTFQRENPWRGGGVRTVVLFIRD